MFFREKDQSEIKRNEISALGRQTLFLLGALGIYKYLSFSHVYRLMYSKDIYVNKLLVLGKLYHINSSLQDIIMAQ